MVIFTLLYNILNNFILIFWRAWETGIITSYIVFLAQQYNRLVLYSWSRQMLCMQSNSDFKHESREKVARHRQRICLQEGPGRHERDADDLSCSGHVSMGYCSETRALHCRRSCTTSKLKHIQKKRATQGVRFNNPGVREIWYEMTSLQLLTVSGYRARGR